MLGDPQSIRDLKQFAEILNRIDTHTDRRYLRDTRALGQAVHQLVDKMNVVLELQRKLESYKSYGFTINGILNKRYSDHDRMLSDVGELITKMNDILPIITEYQKIKHTLSHRARAQFEEVLFNPERHKETKSLWYKINEVTQ